MSTEADELTDVKKRLDDLVDRDIAAQAQDIDEPGIDGSREEEIRYLFNQLKQFLLEKNRRYGDSALTPVKVFSKTAANDALLVRIDDKISRIKNSSIIRKNDVVDLVGYLSLYMIQREWSNLDELID